MRWQERFRCVCLRAFLGCVALSAFLGAENLYAQTSLKSGNEMPDALQNIQPAAGVCRKDDVKKAPGNAGDWQTEKLDMECARTPKEAAQLSEKNDVIMVDLRQPAEFQNSHVANAVNFSEGTVATKKYWRDKTLLLMGTGKLEGEVFRTCSRLKKSGFKQVFVVRGGFDGWRQQGLAVLGQSGMDESRGLSVADFWAEAQQVENKVILDSDRGSLRVYLKDAIVVQKDAVATIRAVLAGNRRGSHGNNPLGFIFVSSPGITPERVLQIRLAAGSIPVLFFSGAESDLAAYEKQQHAVWLAQVRGPKKLGCGL